MKDLSIMTPAELQRAESELTAVRKELTERKKVWRPEVLRIVESTGKDAGTFRTKFETPIGWKHRTREQTAQTIDVVSFDIII
jgi:hypothetical protein